MKKEESRDSLIDIPAEDDRDESQLTGRKAAEYNRQHVIRHRKRVRTKILCALGILLAADGMQKKKDTFDQKAAEDKRNCTDRTAYPTDCRTGRIKGGV